MIKYLFIVINSLWLFIFGLFNASGVSVSSNIPATLIPGQEVTVELKISKAGLEGFSMLQLELPDGIMLKDSDNKGADYGYSAGVAKWTWAAAPAEDELLIKVVLEASAGTGVKTISAKYSYIENNVQQMAEMHAQVTVAAASANASVPMATSNSEPPGKISVARSLTKVSESEYLVTLRIKKGITRGFAKYSDDLMEPFTAKAVQVDGSVFSVADGKIKFVWVNVPEKEELEVSYSITGNFNAALALNGEYSYLEDNQSKKYKLDPEKIPASVAQASTPAEEKPATTLPEVPKQEVATETKEAPKKEKSLSEQLSTDVPKAQPDAVTEKKEGNASFVVQIGAFTSNKTDAASLKKKFKITEAIKSEMHGGYSKYMVGAHAQYKDARYHKEAIKDINGITTAFVVAYSGAKRITVQEALMMTNQKWFK